MAVWPSGRAWRTADRPPLVGRTVAVLTQNPTFRGSYLFADFRRQPEDRPIAGPLAIDFFQFSEYAATRRIVGIR